MGFRVILALLAAFAVGPALAQDDTPSVSGVTSVTGEAPLPIVGDGAANYSPEQTASFLCESEGAPLSFLFSMIPQAAHDATLRARAVRIRALTGQATIQEMEEAELERQKAVSRIGGAGKRTGPPANGRKDLLVEETSYKRFLENGRAVLVVSGKVRNTTEAAVELPPVSMEAIDVRGFILAGQTVQLEQVSIGPGETLSFGLRFKNPPQYTKQVYAYLAPPFLTRNFRGCEFFDPLTFNPNEEKVRKARAEATPVAVPKVGQGAPAYTRAELASMARRVRADAGTSFGNRRSARCIPPAPWRAQMIEADRLEEAWIATTAAEEARRDGATGVFLPSEVADAELSRQAAVRAFMAAQPPPRMAQPVDHPGLVLGKVELSGDERQVKASVSIRNTTRGRVETPALLYTVVDRFGFTVTEAVDYPDNRIREGAERTESMEYSLPRSLVAGIRVTFAC